MINKSVTIDYTDYIAMVWKKKITVIVIVALFSVVSVVVSLSLPNVYRADSLVLAEDHGSQMSSTASQLGGLAAMAGINLKSGGVDKVTLALQILGSRSFQLEFIEKYQLKVIVMGVSEWDEKNDKPIYINDIYDTSSKQWKLAEDGTSLEPSDWDTYDTFSKLVQVEKLKANQFYRIGFDYYSPKEAARITNLLVEEVNQRVKLLDQNKSKKNIAYLEKQLEKTLLADMQVVFYQLIEEENKTLMLSEAQDEYVFSVVDRSVAPEIRLAPKRALICLAGATLGGLIAVFFVIAWSLFREARSERA